MPTRAESSGAGSSSSLSCSTSRTQPVAAERAVHRLDRHRPVDGERLQRQRKHDRAAQREDGKLGGKRAGRRLGHCGERRQCLINLDGRDECQVQSGESCSCAGVVRSEPRSMYARTWTNDSSSPRSPSSARRATSARAAAATNDYSDAVDAPDEEGAGSRAAPTTATARCSSKLQGPSGSRRRRRHLQDVRQASSRFRRSTRSCSWRNSTALPQERDDDEETLQPVGGASARAGAVGRVGSVDARQHPPPHPLHVPPVLVAERLRRASAPPTESPRPDTPADRPRTPARSPVMGGAPNTISTQPR